MPQEPELKRELADERRELTDAVTDLKQELNHAAERGKMVGIGVGTAAAAAITARVLLRLRRRRD